MKLIAPQAPHNLLGPEKEKRTTAETTDSHKQAEGTTGGDASLLSEKQIGTAGALAVSV